MKLHGGQQLGRGKKPECTTPLEEGCSLSLKVPLLLSLGAGSYASQVVSSREELWDGFQSVCVGGNWRD